MKYQKRNYRRGGKRLYKNKTKKLVTGYGPTYLDKIASGAGSVARLARAVAPAIAMINTEVKYFDQSVQQVYFNPGTGDQLNNLTGGIAQGLTDITRIGDSILAKSISLKITLDALMSATIHQTQTRLVLFVWKENANINAPTVAKLFTTPAEFLSGFNKDYTDQFVILKDKVFCHNANISAATNQDSKHIKLFKKLDFHMRFIDGTNTGFSVNHVYLLLRNTGLNAANQGSADFWSRLN
jgi:hypothetical protein